MLEGRVRGENRVVRLDDRAGQLWSRVHAELKLGLLAVIRRQTLQQQSAESRPGTSSKRMEHEESLETRTVVRQTTELIHHGIDELLSDGVVSASICAEVGCARETNREKITRAMTFGLQLFAASSFPVISVSGWKRYLYGPDLTSSMTPGSRSMYSDRGTCFPELDSEKKVENPLSV